MLPDVILAITVTEFSRVVRILKRATSGDITQALFEVSRIANIMRLRGEHSVEALRQRSFSDL
jgi:hypothetical protein